MITIHVLKCVYSKKINNTVLVKFYGQLHSYTILHKHEFPYLKDLSLVASLIC